MSKFIKDLQSLINEHNLENESNTPDFILANYLNETLNSFINASNAREAWYSIKLEPCQDTKDGYRKCCVES